jgi:EAL domain-containing protein (putative c-di-GMP-specific phosphodiesterase class I)
VSVPDAPAAPPITVLVVDDHPMLLGALVRNLDSQPDIEVIASAGSIGEMFEVLAVHAVDVLVIDYHLPDGDGAAAVRLAAERWPAMRSVMLTGSGDGSAMFEAARAGCSGYLDKTSRPAELVRVVRSVSQGGVELPAVELDRVPPLDQLAVHYQPIVDLSTEAIVGFEALVRWAHPVRGLLPPAAFIDIAEQTSLIVDIDQRVREIALGMAAAWNRRFPTPTRRFMSVNLSGRELMLPGLATRVEDVVARAGLEPSDVMLEVTETFLVGDLDACARRLREVSALGVRIALDDFGTGYSSLDHLRRFPIDLIKLDKSFTDELPDGARALKLVETVRRLADDVGAQTESEGIETEAQAACLRDAGWRFGQGYHYFRPQSAESIERVLQSA